MLPSSPLTDPDVQISRFRFLAGELRAQFSYPLPFRGQGCETQSSLPVARQRFSPRDAPLSSIGSRRDQFPDVVSTMRALRLPTHASPVTYLFRFRGPRDSSSVRARRCQRSRAGGGPATGQDHCSAGDLKLPAHLHVDASGTFQVPRRPILCLCPAPRPPPDRRSLANNGRIGCCPCCRESKASSVLIISRLQRGLGPCCLGFKGGVATATCKTRFRLAG